jgi:hypothetical protein
LGQFVDHVETFGDIGRGVYDDGDDGHMTAQGKQLVTVGPVIAVEAPDAA